jgi:hypothetical protein
MLSKFDSKKKKGFFKVNGFSKFLSKGKKRKKEKLKETKRKLLH